MAIFKQRGDCYNTGMADQTITLHVTCFNPPAMPFGLQDKDRAIAEGEMLPDGQLRFVLKLKVKRTNDGVPNFTGAFAHGPAIARFLYLTKLDNSNQIVRRIKVPLMSITWDQVEMVLNDSTAYLWATVEGTRSGTVPLLGDGWTIQHD